MPSTNGSDSGEITFDEYCDRSEIWWLRRMMFRRWLGPIADWKLLEIVWDSYWISYITRG